MREGFQSDRSASMRVCRTRVPWQPLSTTLRPCDHVTKRETSSPVSGHEVAEDISQARGVNAMTVSHDRTCAQVSKTPAACRARGREFAMHSSRVGAVAVARATTMMGKSRKSSRIPRSSMPHSSREGRGRGYRGATSRVCRHQVGRG